MPMELRNPVLGCGQSPVETQPLVARGWRSSLAINALGATVTAIVLVVFVLTKFAHGAWIVVVVLPSLALLLSAIGRHYRSVEEQLKLVASGPVGDCPPNTVLIPVSRVHRGVREALAYARCLSKDVRAVYVEVDPAETEQVQSNWASLATEVRLEVLPSPYRSYVAVLLEHIERVHQERGEGVVTVLLAEFVPPTWWQQVLHNGRTFRLMASLLYRPGIVVVSVPYVLH
jgi:hypothetical protein